MVDFANINQQIREMLRFRFFELVNAYGNEEANIKHFEYFEDLKYANNNLYNIIIGLGFVDHLRLLIDKKDENVITEEEKSTLEIYDTIDDFDDLLFTIDQNQSLLQGITFAPIKYHSLNMVGQAHMFSKLDDKYVAKFNKFYVLEKHALFKDRTIEDFIKMYFDIVKDDPHNDALVYEASYKIADILSILAIGNYNNYSKVVLKMLKNSYKFKKVMTETYPEILFGIDDQLLDLFENQSINDMLSTINDDKDMLQIMIEDFFAYEQASPKIKKEIDYLFDQIASKEIKAKLKEV